MFNFLSGWITHIAGFSAMFTGLGLMLAGAVKFIEGDATVGQELVNKGWPFFLGGMTASGLRRAITKVQNGGVK